MAYPVDIPHIAIQRVPERRSLSLITSPSPLKERGTKGVR